MQCYRLSISALIMLLLATASLPAAAALIEVPTFSVAHGAQGTGNYKGKKDRHEKPGPMNEKKRKKPSWVSK